MAQAARKAQTPGINMRSILEDTSGMELTTCNQAHRIASKDLYWLREQFILLSTMTQAAILTSTPGVQDTHLRHSTHMMFSARDGADHLGLQRPHCPRHVHILQVTMAELSIFAMAPTVKLSTL